MSMNLKVVRIKSKLEEMYNNKIDITDVESNNKFPDQFYTRAIAAQAIIMRCGISEDVAGKCITYLDQEEIKSKVSSICGKYWNKVYEIIEKDFPDAYPAYLFKNVGRLKEIIKKI